MIGKTLITLQGHLDKKWEESFDITDMVYEGVNTILIVNIRDEPHLHGILNLIRDLNLKLISVNPAK